MILNDEESILALALGSFHLRRWLMVCTPKRVIFVSKRWFFGLQQIEIPLAKINSIVQKERLWEGEIEIWNGAAKIVFFNIPKKMVRPFVDTVNKAMEAL